MLHLRGAQAVWMAVAALLAVVVAGCVYPNPPVGEPKPALTISLSKPAPLFGTVTVTAEPEHFVPTQVAFRVGSFNATPFAVDTSAPFSVELDTTTLANATQTIWATGVDGTYTVVQVVSVAVDNRPNVVVVLVDDLDDLTSPYWDALPQTKALLADQGLTFANSFATDPVCCPARASILTGDYPHNTGVFDLTPPDGGLPAFRASGAENDTVGVRLHDAGYRTAYLGKYLAGYESLPSYVPPGWDEWFGFRNGFYDGYGYDVNHNGVIENYGSEPADYQTDVVAARSLEYLDSTEANDIQPFFMMVSPSAPHLAIPPAPRHVENQFTDDALPQRANYDEADVGDKPTWLRAGIPAINTDIQNYLTGDYRNRMGALLAVDDMVASIVARLEARGELDRTLIVFGSDNGYNFGAHRLIAKQAPYEESIRVPLVVRGPGVRVGTDTHFVAHIDLTPTILDLAGLPTSDRDGRSLRPLFAGPTPSWRDDLVIEFNGTYTPTYALHTFANVEAAIAAGTPMAVPTYRALRSAAYLYVEWYAGTVHEYELYDLNSDPFQLENLVGTPAGALQYAATTATLQARLDALRVCSASTCRN